MQNLLFLLLFLTALSCSLDESPEAIALSVLEVPDQSVVAEFNDGLVRAYLYVTDLEVNDQFAYQYDASQGVGSGTASITRYNASGTESILLNFGTELSTRTFSTDGFFQIDSLDLPFTTAGGLYRYDIPGFSSCESGPGTLTIDTWDAETTIMTGEYFASDTSLTCENDGLRLISARFRVAVPAVRF